MSLVRWMRFGVLGAVLVGTARPVPAAELTWNGEFRLRAESIERSLLGGPVQWDFLQRARIGVTAKINPEMSAFAQLQDARLWGAEGNTLADLRNTDLHQGYLDLSPAAAAGLRLRIGRQELSYGDERIVGAAAFNNVSRSFDGVQVRMQRGNFVADAVAARAADATAVAAGNDDVFFTYDRWSNAAADRAVEAYVLYRASPGAKFETTLGERLVAARGDFRLEEEFAYQLGRRALTDLGAFLLATQMKWQGNSRCTLGAGADWLSGDDPTTTADGFFDTGRLFGTAHKFYGRLDLAESIAGRAGLVDPYATVQVQGPGALRIRLDAHRLLVHRDEVPQLGGPKPAVGGESVLGTEFDLGLQLPWQATRFEVLASVLFPGARLDAVGLDRTAWFGYFTTQVVF